MIGIIGAMEIETKGIKNLIEKPAFDNVSSIEFVSGRMHGKDVVCAMCNPGKVNAALCAQAMIMKYNPEIIINSGVAGSLSDDLDVLSVAVGSACVQHDFDLSPLGMPKGMVDGVNIIEFECDKRACEILEKVTSKYNTKIGTIATGDVFVSGNDAKSKIAKDFGAIACEMEGGAIAHVCMVNNTKFAALRTISDGANEMDFNTFKVKAADMAIEIIDNFIKEY